MSDPTYDLVQVDADGRIMDYMVREDIMSIAREAMPGGGGGSSVVQGWDGMYLGSLRIADGAPKWLGLLLAPLAGPISEIFDGTQTSITNILGEEQDLTTKTDLIFFNFKAVEDGDDTIITVDPDKDGQFIWHRDTVTSDWAPVADNRAWDGTVIELASYGMNYRAYEISAQLLSASGSFQAPHGDDYLLTPTASPDEKSIYQESVFPDRLSTAEINTYTNKVTFKRESGSTFDISQVAVVPGTHTQTVNAGVTPWKPSDRSLPSGGGSRASAPLGTIVRLVGAGNTVGVYSWIRVLGGGWRVNSGDTGELSIRTWADSKVPHVGGGFQHYVRLTDAGYLARLTSLSSFNSSAQATVFPVAIPYWHYSSNGLVNKNACLLSDLQIQVDARDASGTPIIGVKTSLSTTGADYATLTFDTGTSIPATMNVSIAAPSMSYWPTAAILDGWMSNRPKT